MTVRGSLPPTAVPGRGHRPGTVLGAAACYWLAALLLASQSAQAVIDMGLVGTVTRQAGAATGATPLEMRDEISAARMFDALTLVLVLMLAAMLALSAAGFVRGNDRAWVVALGGAALVMLCCSVAVIGTVVGGYQPEATEFQRKVTQLLEARTPGWTSALALAALGVYPLLIAGMVSLLVPASRRYFRPLAEYYVFPLPHRG